MLTYRPTLPTCIACALYVIVIILSPALVCLVYNLFLSSLFLLDYLPPLLVPHILSYVLSHLSHPSSPLFYLHVLLPTSLNTCKLCVTDQFRPTDSSCPSRMPTELLASATRLCIAFLSSISNTPCRLFLSALLVRKYYFFICYVLLFPRPFVY